MIPLFHPVSARAIGQGVRRTLLELRFSAQLPCRSKRSNNYLAHQLDVAAVRWLDLHCQLNGLRGQSGSQHQ